MTTAMTSPPWTPPVLTCLPAPRHVLLRPQCLMRLSVCSRARRSRRLPAPIDRARVPGEDVRLRAGTRISPRCSTG
jgi:hypothetical protein